MKHLILLTCFLGLLAHRASAQTSSADTVVWGNVQTNFPGGQEAYNTYVSDSTVYSKLALTNNIMGSDYLCLTIEPDGSLSKIVIFHDLGAMLDEAALKVIHHSGKWVPSLVNGKPVRTICNAPVNFVLTLNHNHELLSIVNGLSPQDALTSVPLAPNAIIISPPLIPLKDVKENLGMMVTIKDVVYGLLKANNTVSLFMGGQHPHELLRIVISGEAFDAYKNKKLDGKVIFVTGTPEVSKDGLQLEVSNPRFISLNGR